MATNFLDLLKSKKTIINNDTQWHNKAIKIDSNFGTKDQTIVDVTPIGYGPDPVPVINVRAERVLDRGRLDLFFSSKPVQETLNKLRDQGFRWNPDNKTWYHKDNLINRLFVADTFGLSELLQDQFNDDPKIADNGKESTISSDPMVEHSPEYETFKKQVNALQKELKLDAADLMLKAIDFLYTSTFKVN